MRTEKPLIYLASPHTHPHRSVVDMRFRQARSATINLMCKGYIVYSPIVYTHPLWRLSQAIQTGLEGLDKWKHGDWLAFDRHMMARCDECIVLQLTGWDASVGVRMEINYFTSMGKPVSYFTLDEVIKASPYQA